MLVRTDFGTVGTRAPRHLAHPVHPVAPCGTLVIVIVVLLVLVEVGDDVRHVEEAVALEADVDERRLHAGQDFRDPALVDVADDAAILLALDEQFSELVVLENGDAGFVAVRGDDHFLVHGGISEAEP